MKHIPIPARRAVGSVRRDFPLLILSVALALWLLPVARVAGQCCVNLAGSWNVDEEAHFTIYMNGEFYDDYSRSGSGTVTISQSGCQIHFTSEAPNPLGAGTIRLARTGTVSGQHVTWNGPAAGSIQGVSCPTNRLHGVGRVEPSFSGGEMTFDTSGTVYCVSGRDTLLVVVRGSSTFSTGRNLVFPPTVSVSPVSRSVTTSLAPDGARLPGSNVTFTANVDEVGSFTYRWLRNGQAIPGATNDVLVLSNVTSSSAGAYTVEVRAGSCRIMDTATLAVDDSAVPDNVPPALNVLHPAAGILRLATNNPVFVLRGTARDNRGLAGVYLQSGAGPFTPVSGTSNWFATVNLGPGSNVFRFKAVDTAGNSSPVVARVVVFVITSPLTVLTHGLGAVTPNLNGQLLELGRNFTLTATPGAGFVFSNWTGDLPTSLSPKLTFSMRSNLTLSANFVPNPFLPVKGGYNGLFYEDHNVRQDSSGFFTLVTTDAGAYSGALTLAGVKLPVSGRFDLEGGATNFINRRGADPVSVEWAMDLHGANQVTGLVSTASWRARLVGDRAVFNTRTHPAALGGKFTFVMPGAADEPTKPAGDGFGTSSVDAGGKVSFSGTLADGTKFAASAPLSQSGMFPFYAALYRKRGSVLSWVAFDTHQPNDDLHGLLSWIRPPDTTPKSYTNGFELDSALTGSLYRPPTGRTNRIVGITNGLVILSGGGLAESSFNTVVLGLNNKLTNAGPDKLTVTFKPASGLFTGTWMPTGTTARVSFGGAVLQKAHRGSGFFLRTNLSGRVEFEAAP